MFTVYVLHSRKHNKIYIGFTSDIRQRLLSHNVLEKKGWTIRYRPWEPIYKEEYASKADATKREKELKTATGRKFIWTLINAT